MNNGTNTEEAPQDMKDRVLGEIKHDHLHMQSQARIRLHHLVAIIGLILFIFLTVYFGSFIIFARHAAGLGFRLHSLHESLPFLISLPWIFILLAVIAIVFLEKLLRQYKALYRRPILLSLIGVILVAFFGSLLLTRLHFHEGLADFAEHRNLPFFRPLYHDHWQRGMMHGMFPPVFPGTTTRATTAPPTLSL